MIDLCFENENENDIYSSSEDSTSFCESDDETTDDRSEDTFIEQKGKATSRGCCRSDDECPNTKQY